MSEETIEVSAIERIAKAGGWSPKEDWRGAEDGWKSAESFVEAGIGIQAKQAEKIDRLQNTVEKVEGNIKNMAKGETKRLKQALESQKERIEAKRQEAFDESDTEAFNKADKELTETHQQISDLSDDPVAQEFAAGEKDFMKTNPWYGKDIVLTNEADSLSQTILRFNQNISADEYYEQIEASVREKYPDKFRNTNRDKGGMVSGDSPKFNQRKGNGFESLSPEEKHAYAQIAEYSPNFSKDDYAKQILEQE